MRGGFQFTFLPEGDSACHASHGSLPLAYGGAVRLESSPSDVDLDVKAQVDVTWLVAEKARLVVVLEDLVEYQRANLVVSDDADPFVGERLMARIGKAPHYLSAGIPKHDRRHASSRCAFNLNCYDSRKT